MSALHDAIAAGRAASEARMTEQIHAASYTETEDETSLETVRTIAVFAYQGPALVKYPSLTVRDVNAGSAQFDVSDIVVKVPASAGVLPVGVIIIVISSTEDASLAQREFRVKGAPQAGQTTSHRYPVEEMP